jgi:hypothetical protein
MKVRIGILAATSALALLAAACSGGGGSGEHRNSPTNSSDGKLHAVEQPCS